jgi:hypothetical protein
MISMARKHGFVEKWTLAVVVLAAAMVIGAKSEARIIRVPADEGTIQEGLNTAAPGDTVLVAHGTYFENLLWPPTQDIKLYANEQAPPESTIISGTFAYLPVVRIPVAVGLTTEIRCFVVENGSGESGAGILCSAGASPTILWNLLRENNATLYGGGIFVGQGCRPVIEDNTIDWNVAQNGGGIYSDRAFPTIRGNRIRHNDVGNGIGGGIHIESGAAIVERNKITYNKTMYEAAGIYTCGDSSRIEFNNISYNVCFSHLPGGGVFT